LASRLHSDVHEWTRISHQYGNCQIPLRLTALIKNELIASKILVAMHLPATAPQLHPARPLPGRDGELGHGEDWAEDRLSWHGHLGEGGGGRLACVLSTAPPEHLEPPLFRPAVRRVPHPAAAGRVL
jgi:hypothetical protein